MKKISKNLMEAHRRKTTFLVRPPYDLTGKELNAYSDKLAKLLAAESLNGREAKIPQLIHRIVMAAEIE